MADKKDYYLYAAGERVLVSKEVHDAIVQMNRQERTQSDKDKRNKLLRYEELTTGSILGEELICDSLQESVESIALTNIICCKLHKAIEMLPPSERELIQDLYFNGKSMRYIAEKRGVSHMTVQRAAKKILKKLKIFMQN